MKKLTYLLTLLSLLLCCSPFVRIANKNQVANVNGYIELSNPEAQFKSSTFGDVKFAMNLPQFKKLNPTGPPQFKNILAYAKTFDPAYEYYILYNPSFTAFDTQVYEVKDTVINQSRFVLLISKTAPGKDVDFIKREIKRY